MANRTFVIGDIHGDLDALTKVLGKLPALTTTDKIVFLGDYVDCGPNVAGVVNLVRELPKLTLAQVVCLRGNHEDGWLRAIDGGWPDFVMPPGNGCLQTMESFLGRPVSPRGTGFEVDDLDTLFSGAFFPKDVVEWMKSLPYYFEDEYAIYVHAGLTDVDGRFLHPSECKDKQLTALLWTRDKKFFKDYRGKMVIFGHTATNELPPEDENAPPTDTEDIWTGVNAVGLDTRCGKGGFLTCLELPTGNVYESRD